MLMNLLFIAIGIGLLFVGGEALIRGAAIAPGGLLTRDRIVNVLELNLALDRL